MDFLYVFRGGNERVLSPEQMQAHLQEWGAWIGQLPERGAQVKGGNPLADGGRVVAGKNKQVTDGPYGETKDLVGGYLLVTAESFDVATELARGCPILQGGGSVEVREVRPMSH